MDNKASLKCLEEAYNFDIGQLDRALLICPKADFAKAAPRGHPLSEGGDRSCNQGSYGEEYEINVITTEGLRRTWNIHVRSKSMAIMPLAR